MRIEKSVLTEAECGLILFPTASAPPWSNFLMPLDLPWSLRFSIVFRTLVSQTPKSHKTCLETPSHRIRHDCH